MKKLSEYMQTYYDFSGKASDISRQLAFAGIAIIWIFKTTNNTGFIIPTRLFYPLLLFAIGLGCDLMQYICGTIVWGSFQWYQERKFGTIQDPDLDAPSWFKFPQMFFFCAKLLLIMMAYIYLGIYLIKIIK